MKSMSGQVSLYSYTLKMIRHVFNICCSLNPFVRKSNDSDEIPNITKILTVIFFTLKLLFLNQQMLLLWPSIALLINKNTIFPGYFIVITKIVDVIAAV